MTDAPLPYDPPSASVTNHDAVGADGNTYSYTAEAGWILFKADDEPLVEIFSVYYRVGAADPTTRPLTFVFNGGPGASSAFLHLGALGPVRVVFDDDGTVPAGAARLTANRESWLPFTDLVFVDPVGTGFSRIVPDRHRRSVPPGSPPPKSAEAAKEERFFGTTGDLRTLCEFVQRFLSKHERWGSPVSVCGESYGGFRGAKLSRLLQEHYGVGLSAVVLVSPALELSTLDPTDYDVIPWVDVLPAMAATAAWHRGARGDAIAPVLREAEGFATGPYATYLLRGAASSHEDEAAVIADAARLTGLPEAVVSRSKGRVSRPLFARELLRDARKLVGCYDGSMTTIDPFPDRPDYPGPDASFSGIDRTFTEGVNALLRNTLRVGSDRDYVVVNLEVNRVWKEDSRAHAYEAVAGACDDLRYGLALNESMKVLVCHGYFDLVTPYFASDRLVELMKLPPGARERVMLRHYEGGHMFYTKAESRRAFTREAGTLFG